MSHKYQGWAIARTSGVFENGWIAAHPQHPPITAATRNGLIYAINTRIINARIDAAERAR